MGINLDKRIYKTTYNKMKLTGAVVIAAVAADKKVPPRHPLQRLAKLTEFSAEILNDWYGFLPSKDSWIAKFETNAGRMERNFQRGEQRCGFYDEDQLPHGGPERRRRSGDDYDVKYNREDPSIGIKQITTGYRKWADRYLSQCGGQRKNAWIKNRMNKWNNKLQAKLAEHYAEE